MRAGGDTSHTIFPLAQEHVLWYHTQFILHMINYRVVAILQACLEKQTWLSPEFCITILSNEISTTHVLLYTIIYEL